MTISIKIKNLKARKLLEDLAMMDLIEITGESIKESAQKDALKEKTLTHIASEKSLAKTWDNKEEDEAWQNL